MAKLNKTKAGQNPAFYILLTLKILNVFVV